MWRPAVDAKVYQVSVDGHHSPLPSSGSGTENCVRTRVLDRRGRCLSDAPEHPLSHGARSERCIPSTSAGRPYETGSASPPGVSVPVRCPVGGASDDTPSLPKGAHAAPGGRPVSSLTVIDGKKMNTDSASSLYISLNSAHSKLGVDDSKWAPSKEAL